MVFYPHDKGPLDKEFSIYIYTYTHQFFGSILVDSGVYSISNWLRCCLLNFIRMNHPQIYVYIHIPYIKWLYDWYATTTWKARHEKRCFTMFVSCRVMCIYIYTYIYIFFFLVHVNLFGQNKIKHTPDHGEMCEVSQLCSQYAQYVKMDTVWGLPKPWKLQDFHCEPMFFWSKIQLWDLMTYVSHHVT